MADDLDEWMTAARDQGAEWTVEVEPAGEQVVVDLEDVARGAGDQADRLIARIAWRVRQGFVLGSNVAQRRRDGHPGLVSRQAGRYFRPVVAMPVVMKRWSTAKTTVMGSSVSTVMASR